MKIVLVNPNTSTTVTSDMVYVAECELARLNIEGEIYGLTAHRGARLIDTPASLAIASDTVAGLASDLREFEADAIILSAFGDPGVRALREELTIPVVALAESALMEADKCGAFAIVTSTPALQGHLEALVAAECRGNNYRGIEYTDGDISSLMRDPAALTSALQKSCTDVLERLNVVALVIGGGPLARAAFDIRLPTGVVLIDPIQAAVRRVIERLGSLH